MSPVSIPTTKPSRYYLAQSSFRKFTLEEYHKMIAHGVLMDGEPYELLEGNLVHKMARGTPHDTALDLLEELLLGLVPSLWYPRSQKALALTNSEPEPDIALVPGPRRRYLNGHPSPVEARLLIEVSDSSLLIDRHDKGIIYAGAAIPVYWVVNVVDKQIEVYTLPSGSGDSATYTKREDYRLGSAVPVVLDGVTVGSITVGDVFG